MGLNNNSLVFKLVFNDFAMLFPGDIHSDREHLIANLTGDQMEADILLAPHHGSNTSSSKFFLDHVRAKSVIMSCGFQNRYGFPHPSVLIRYKDSGLSVFRTDLHGAVTITSNGSGYEIKTVKGE